MYFSEDVRDVFAEVEYLSDEELKELADGELLSDIKKKSVLKYIEEIRRKKVLLNISDLRKIINTLPQYVPVHIVTKLTGLSRKTIYRYIKNGRLKAIKTETNRWLIPKEEILKIVTPSLNIVEQEIKKVENTFAKLPKIEINVREDDDRYVIEIPKTLVQDVLGMNVKKVWIVKAKLLNQPVLIILNRVTNI